MYDMENGIPPVRVLRTPFYNQRLHCMLGSWQANDILISVLRSCVQLRSVHQFLVGLIYILYVTC